MQKTYLVTGGAGFIGSNFVLYVLSEYDDICVINVDKLTYAGNPRNLDSVIDDPRHVFLQTDICDASAINKIFEDNTIDYVVNFAAESHVDRSIETPELFALTNVMGTVNLLNSAKAAWEEPGGSFGNHKFLQVSTDEVYGSLPIDDSGSFFQEDTPLNPHSPYSASKAAADLFVKSYGDTYKLPVNITRCSNNYGPYQFPEKLIPLIINNALQHRKLPVYGDGLNVRDWLYVEDHCKAIDLVLREGAVGEVYNVGGHNEQNNITIVKRIINELATIRKDTEINDTLISYVEDRKGHDRRYGIDPNKIKKDLGWHPETNFEDGIVRTIAWYLEHEAWMMDITSGAYREYYSKMYENRMQGTSHE